MTEASRRTEAGGNGKQILCKCSLIDSSPTCTLPDYLFFSLNFFLLLLQYYYFSVNAFEGNYQFTSHLSAYRAWQTRQNDRKKHRKGAETDREGDSAEEKRRVVTLLRGKMFHTRPSYVHWL